MHDVLKCPKGDLCDVKEGVKGEYAFQQSSGYRNAFRHLLKCHAGSNTEYLMDRYNERKSETQPSINNFLTNSTQTHSYNTKEKAMHDYIRFIVDTGAPVRVVEKNSFRNLSKYR